MQFHFENSGLMSVNINLGNSASKWYYITAKDFAKLNLKYQESELNYIYTYLSCIWPHRQKLE